MMSGPQRAGSAPSRRSDTMEASADISRLRKKLDEASEMQRQLLDEQEKRSFQYGEVVTQLMETQDLMEHWQSVAQKYKGKLSAAGVQLSVEELQAEHYEPASPRAAEPVEGERDEEMEDEERKQAGDGASGAEDDDEDAASVMSGVSDIEEASEEVHRTRVESTKQYFVTHADQVSQRSKLIQQMRDQERSLAEMRAAITMQEREAAQAAQLEVLNAHLRELEQEKEQLEQTASTKTADGKLRKKIGELERRLAATRRAKEDRSTDMQRNTRALEHSRGQLKRMEQALEDMKREKVALERQMRAETKRYVKENQMSKRKIAQLEKMKRQQSLQLQRAKDALATEQKV